MKNIEFRQLHFQNSPLFLINIWDAASAIIIQNLSAKALATSSASIAWANGYCDGSQLPKSSLINTLNNILRVSSLPVSVDIEDGYSDSPQEVASLVAELIDIGVSGVNIEDGYKSSELLAKKIIAIKSLPTASKIFVNARTDVYLQGLVSEERLYDECVERLHEYVKHGADGVFVPGLNDASIVQKIVNTVNAPLNIMVDSEQACDQLFKAGAKRISLGPNPFIESYSRLSDISQNTNQLFKLDYNTMNGLFQNP